MLRKIYLNIKIYVFDTDVVKMFCIKSQQFLIDRTIFADVDK